MTVWRLDERSTGIAMTREAIMPVMAIVLEKCMLLIERCSERKKKKKNNDE